MKADENPRMILKYYSESCFGHVQLRLFLHPIRGGHRRKSTNDTEGRSTEIMVRLPEQYLQLVRVF
jgi:hypothetical protein